MLPIKAAFLFTQYTLWHWIVINVPWPIHDAITILQSKFILHHLRHVIIILQQSLSIGGVQESFGGNGIATLSAAFATTTPFHWAASAASGFSGLSGRELLGYVVKYIDKSLLLEAFSLSSYLEFQLVYILKWFFLLLLPYFLHVKWNYVLNLELLLLQCH